jgi:hypothetical protein
MSSLCDECVNVNRDIKFSIHEEIEECEDYLMDDEFEDDDFEDDEFEDDDFMDEDDTHCDDPDGQ